MNIGYEHDMNYVTQMHSKSQKLRLEQEHWQKLSSNSGPNLDTR